MHQRRQSVQNSIPRGCLIVRVERIMQRVFDDRESVQNSQQEIDLLFPICLHSTLKNSIEIG